MEMTVKGYNKEIKQARVKLDHLGNVCVNIDVDESFVAYGKTFHDKKQIRQDKYNKPMDQAIVDAFWEEVKKAVINEI